MAAGNKTGGRSKGTPNKATAAKAAAIEASGLTPLDYLLSVLRDDATEQATRLDAAKAAAPYVHPRLASIDLRGEIEATMVIRAPETAADSATWQQQHAPRR